MAQDGDTITYTYSVGDSITEDVSTISEMVIDSLKGAGGYESDNGNKGGAGGAVEGVVVDLSGVDEIYIWVAGSNLGRYDGAESFGGFNESIGGDGTGSSEVSLINTNDGDSDTEPFIAAAGGGGGGGGGDAGGGDGARGGSAQGEAPPQGGTGGGLNQTGGDGDGAVGGHGTTATITDTGTTTTGGGFSNGISGEIQISYKSFPPDAPTNLSATLQ